MKITTGPVFPNLAGEMGRHGLTIADISRKAQIKYNTLRSKLGGSSDWTREEMLSIRNSCFPGKELEWLFERFEQTA